MPSGSRAAFKLKFVCAFVCENICACMGLCVCLQACDCVFLVKCLLRGVGSQCLPVLFVFKVCLHLLYDITAQCVSAVTKLRTVCALKDVNENEQQTFSVWSDLDANWLQVSVTRNINQCDFKDTTVRRLSRSNRVRIAVIESFWKSIHAFSVTTYKGHGLYPSWHWTRGAGQVFSSSQGT